MQGIAAFIFLFLGGANVEGPLLRKLLSKRISILSTTLKTRDKEVKKLNNSVYLLKNCIVLLHIAAYCKPVVGTSW